jgi:hypothetical protein
VEDQLLFLIGSPRSGSTLLSRMIGAHSAVHSPPEPHLLTPLAQLGYYDAVDRAAYDPIISQRAIREIVAALPRGEEDYLDALRAYTDEVYQRLLAPTGRRILLDKTPAYALCLEFAARLYPRARYAVLTRNPLAVWSSYVQSFFDGDHEAAHRHNPLLERYVPAIARFLREAAVPLHHLRYEDLVAQPRDHMQALCDFAGLPFEEGMVRYGDRAQETAEVARGLGDPITVGKEKEPTTRSVARWAEDMAGDPGKLEQAEQLLAGLADEDLRTWGYERRDLEAQLAEVPSVGPRRSGRALSRYTLERKLLVLLRRNIQHNAFGRLVRRIREVCDVLLR